MPLIDRFHRHGWPVLLVLLLASGQGCTSVLSTASLRDLVWDGDEPHAAESATDASDEIASTDTPAEDAAGDAEPDPSSADAERREAAIEEAVSRLAKLGEIGEAARASLMETLERTAPEDWPAVIDAFAESLPPAPHVAAKADLDAAMEPAAEPEPAITAAAPEPDVPAKEAPVVTVAVAPSPEPPADEPPVLATPAPAETRLTVENACFATRVQALGVVDRFAADRFRPGQEVIVYFELAGLSASESAAGHTTCIDSTLRLVAADGSILHAWSFEPIAETCQARRHDYFARYVVRLPETTAAGPCRIELAVTDTLSGEVAAATLPLEVLPQPTGRAGEVVARRESGRVE